MESRLAPRFPVYSPIVFTTERVFGGVGEGTVVNLSAGGWMIESSDQVQPGRHVTARVRLPGERVPLKVYLATVRWAHGGRFGLSPFAMGIDAW